MDFPKITPEDLVRDATADLTVCEAATPGPWAESFRGYSIDVNQAGGEHIAQLHWSEPSLLHESRERDAVFIALARAALPAWIRRAVAAESEVVRLKQAIADLRTHYEDEPDYCE